MKSLWVQRGDKKVQARDENNISGSWDKKQS